MKSIGFFCSLSFGSAIQNPSGAQDGASILDTPKPFCHKS
jgi:hypothetical protein